MGLLENEIYRIRQRLGDIYSLDGQQITINTVSLEGEFTYDLYLDVWNKSARTIFSHIIKNFSTRDFHRLIPGFIDTHVFSFENPVSQVDISLVVPSDSLFRIISVSSGSELLRYLPYDEFRAISSFVYGKYYTYLKNTLYLSIPLRGFLMTYVKYVDNSPAYFSPEVRDKIVDLAIFELNAIRNQNNPQFLLANSGSLNSQEDK